MADGCVDNANDINDEFLSTTLGDMIDKENLECIKNEILLNIKERKKRKKACNKEAVLRDFNITENMFIDCIERLVEEKLLYTRVRSGCEVYTPQEPQQESNFVEDNLSDDYIQFKRYVSESLAILNERVEGAFECSSNIHLKSEIDRYKSELGSKDVIISFLREEVNYLREENLRLCKLQRQTQCCVTTQKVSHDVINFNSPQENISLSMNIPSETKNDQSHNKDNRSINHSIEQQLSEVRAKLKSSFYSSTLTSVNNCNKTKAITTHNGNIKSLSSPISVQKKS